MTFEKFFPSRLALLKWKSTRDHQAYARVAIEENGVVKDDSELQPTIPLPPSKYSLKQTFVYIIILYTIISSGFLIRLIFSKSSYNGLSSCKAEADSATMLSPCGSTPAEARAAGCLFDIMAFSWLPPRCYDADLSDEFRQLKDWEYYLDRNRTMPFSQEQAFTGEFTGLYTKYEYHLRHCTFLWKKMHRALLRGGGGKLSIDSVTAGYAHTEHCSEMLMSSREVPLDVINSVILVKYPDCGMA